MGSATILLVDDDDAIRRIIRSILEVGGYEVIDVALPSTASRLFQNNPAAFDLLITDVNTPVMTGPALADRLSDTRPDLPVLFISGRIDLANPLHPGEPHRRVLAKPFEAAALLEETRALLSTVRGEPDASASHGVGADR
jgi:CheY-like chemotaxis protein